MVLYRGSPCSDCKSDLHFCSLNKEVSSDYRLLPLTCHNRPFLREILASRFHMLKFTTLQRQVPFISIDRRVAFIFIRLKEGSTWSVGFPPQRMPLLEVYHLPLASKSRCGLSSNTFIRLRAHHRVLDRLLQ